MVKITIFGLAGSGTSSVGKLFASRNNLKFISTGDMFRQMAVEHGFEFYEFSKLCKTDSKYDIELDKRVIEFGKTNDNFIVESRLAWHFISDSIKIKIDCNFDERVRRVAERDEISINDAKEKTLNREQYELDRYSGFYNIKDYSNNLNFDFIVDSTSNDIKEVTKKIEIFLKNKIIN